MFFSLLHIVQTHNAQMPIDYWNVLSNKIFLTFFVGSIGAHHYCIVEKLSC